MAFQTNHSDPSIEAHAEDIFSRAIEATEVPLGHVKRVIHEGAEGCFYATQDQCTHGLASLSDGFLIGEFIECPLHQGMFDVRTGEATAAPCDTTLKTYKTSLKDGVIFLARSFGK